MIKKIVFTHCIVLVLGLFTAPLAYSWGFFAHKKIHWIGLQLLPEPLIGFYKQHANFVVDQAVAPDKRRYVSEHEAARHYIDYDRYDPEKCLDVIPKNWCEATLKYGEDSLKKHGILPWQIRWTYQNLETAFKNQDYDEVLLLSADLGHYIADAHVPLHTTRNYNGQLSNQHGIHGFWESRVPEMHFEEYRFWVGRAEYIPNMESFIWQIIFDSHLAVDSVLSFEKILCAQFPQDQKYGFEYRGQTLTKTYSKEYTQAYSKLLNGMVERRMRRAAWCVASFWYTAWINAQKPELPFEINPSQKKGLEKLIQALDLAFEKNKILGPEHEH